MTETTLAVDQARAAWQGAAAAVGAHPAYSEAARDGSGPPGTGTASSRARADRDQGPPPAGTREEVADMTRAAFRHLSALDNAVIARRHDAEVGVKRDRSFTSCRRPARSIPLRPHHQDTADQARHTDRSPRPPWPRKLGGNRKYGGADPGDADEKCTDLPHNRAPNHCLTCRSYSPRNVSRHIPDWDWRMMMNGSGRCAFEVAHRAQPPPRIVHAARRLRQRSGRASHSCVSLSDMTDLG